MKLNNKGFTLVEVLAAVVILSILIAIMVPSVNNMLNKNKEDNYNNLKNGIINAAKVYMSDNRYDIEIEGGCNSSNEEKEVKSIGDNSLIGSKLPIKWLVDSNDLSTDADGKISNPKDDRNLNLVSSYVLVKYQCSTKDYTYTIVEDSADVSNNSLQWE